MSEEDNWIKVITDTSITWWDQKDINTRKYAQWPRKRYWKTSGVTSYYDNSGNWHREDGPARYNDTLQEWWYHGIEIKCTSQQEFERYLRLKIFW